MIKRWGWVERADELKEKKEEEEREMKREIFRVSKVCDWINGEGVSVWYTGICSIFRLRWWRRRRRWVRRKWSFRCAWCEKQTYRNTHQTYSNTNTTMCQTSTFYFWINLPGLGFMYGVALNPIPSSMPHSLFWSSYSFKALVSYDPNWCYRKWMLNGS